MSSLARPKEGDLIYFPLGDRIFEIKFVEHGTTFLSIKEKLRLYTHLWLFRYEDEVIDTGIETIDDTVQDIGYIQTLNLIGAAQQATSICWNLYSWSCKLRHNDEYG